MTTQTQQWNKLIKPGIVALVGAGGKTTVLSKLVEYGRLAGQPMMVTTTTRLYESQVAQWNPYYGDDVNKANEVCSAAIQKGQCAAWFASVVGTKVEALDTKHIDDMNRLHSNWQIIVEADGAKEKWLKAPKGTEPVIPSLTQTTIGVVNLQMLGSPLDEEHVHNMDIVLDLLNRDEGAIVTPSLLAKLVLHKQGLFQYSKGKKILFCTGYDTVQHRIIDDFIDHVVDSDIAVIVLADGYKASCEIRRIIQCRQG